MGDIVGSGIQRGWSGGGGGVLMGVGLAAWAGGIGGVGGWFGV